MERMYFFDSTETDERIYQAADFARFHAQIIGNGVSNTENMADLAVTSRSNMGVALGTGYMFAKGYMYENDTSLTLTHTIADSQNDRIDRIVIRFDLNPSERRIYAYIKRGTPASNPVAPGMTRNEYIYEMSVARVRIPAGKSFIEQSQITDERQNQSVCGYILLHNIYRGLYINEKGMVTMPNQSYVEMSHNVNLTVGGQSGSGYVQTNVPIVPTIDKQSEISAQQFTPKADGVYQFNFHVAFEDSMRTTEKIEAYLVINNRNNFADRVYLFNRSGTGFQDMHSFGSGIKQLNAGDKVRVVVATRDFGGSRVSHYRRLSITKIS